MHSLSLGGMSSLLCIGAHADDIEIGCGGTIMTLLRDNPDLSVSWIVLSSGRIRELEAHKSARTFLGDSDRHSVVVKSFRNGFFPHQPAIKEYFEELKNLFAPDLIMTHRREDRHQDHRVTSDLTWNTFRDHLILEYEIPKWDGDVGQPNLYVPLEAWALSKKIGNLESSFPSQRQKQWYDADTFRSLMRIRGLECNSPSRFAEAFFGRKIAVTT